MNTGRDASGELGAVGNDWGQIGFIAQKEVLWASMEAVYLPPDEAVQGGLAEFVNQ